MPEGRMYTSARIHTRDRGHWTYGFFEARMKTPTGRGMWPAFWMLPQPESPQNTGNKYGGWAASGEIDIMEAKGRLENRVDTTLHFGNWGMSTYKTSTTRMKTSTEEWHIYALEWTELYMAWYVDGLEVFRVTSREWWSQAVGGNAAESNAVNQAAPFDVDFYILINLAVGGNYDGGNAPDESFTSAAMYVDYVRVYQAV